MKMTHTLVAALLVFLGLTAASHTTMASAKTINVDLVEKTHNCDGCASDVDNLRKELKGGASSLLHKASKVSGKPKGSVSIVSKNANDFQAQIAEASGDAEFCSKTVGTLNIVRIEGSHEKFLVGNAHSFYDNGKLKCGDAVGYIYPDMHYGANHPYGIDNLRKYSFELPPLNHSDLKKFKGHVVDPDRVRDLVVLKVSYLSLFERQTGGSRKSIELLDADHTILKDYAQANAFFISRRVNFEDYVEVAYEENCQISDFRLNGRLTELKKFSCDTGDNSSGASINVMNNNQIYSLGIYYGASYRGIDGSDGNGVEFSQQRSINENSAEGNFFIPSHIVIEAIKKVADPIIR